ncbi:MAG: C2 family cysteine protease [Archangium sp.]|nr:C2 family cysteine protease [Archangium sp.]
MPITRLGNPPAVRSDTTVAAPSAPAAATEPVAPSPTDDFSTPAPAVRGPALSQPSMPGWVVANAVTYGTGTGDSLYINDVEAKDPVQGALGDCYLVATLSAYAQSRPEVLKKAITENADGTFTVRLFKREQVSHGPRAPASYRFVGHEVRIDAQLPRYFGVIPVFARGQMPQELWAPLIEKAYAQLHGGYDKIEGDFPSKVMEALTGEYASTRLNFFFSTDGTFDRIDRALRRNQPVTAATFRPELAGLVPGHAYTVLSAGEENGQRYVELRNPWGRGEPARDGQDDGVFRLTPGEFKKNFPGVFIDD